MKNYRYLGDVAQNDVRVRRAFVESEGQPLALRLVAALAASSGGMHPREVARLTFMQDAQARVVAILDGLVAAGLLERERATSVYPGRPWLYRAVR